MQNHSNFEEGRNSHLPGQNNTASNVTPPDTHASAGVREEVVESMPILVNAEVRTTPGTVSRQEQLLQSLNGAYAWLWRYRLQWVSALIVAMLIEELIQRHSLETVPSWHWFIYIAATLYGIASGALRDFFTWCAGANRDVLDRVPSERTTYAGYGALIFMTAVFASCSGGYALFTVFHSVLPATIFGLLWGVAIFLIDRQIVSTMRHPGTETSWQIVAVTGLTLAAPRLLLSIAIGLVVSQPLELKLLEGPIEQRMYDEKHAAAIRELNSVRSRYQDEIKQRTSQRDELEEQIATLRKKASDKREEYYREIDGRNIGKPGHGHIAIGLEQEVSKLDRLADAKQREVQPRLDQLNRLLVQKNYEYERELANKKRALDEVETRKFLDKENNFLDRYIALGKLRHDPDKGEYTSQLSLGIMLLILLVEMVPTLVKTLAFCGRNHLYDDVYNELEAVPQSGIQDTRLRRSSARLSELALTQHHQRQQQQDIALDDHRRETERGARRLEMEMRRLQQETQESANQTQREQMRFQAEQQRLQHEGEAIILQERLRVEAEQQTATRRAQLEQERLHLLARERQQHELDEALRRQEADALLTQQQRAHQAEEDISREMVEQWLESELQTLRGSRRNAANRASSGNGANTPPNASSS